MKTRQGFVSNSSNSSFIIRGVKLKTSKALKLLGLKLKTKEELGEDYYGSEDLAFETIQNYINKKCKKLYVENPNGYEEGNCESFVVGLSWGSGEFHYGGIVSIDVEKEMAKDDEILAMLNKVGIVVDKKDLKLHLCYICGG